MGEALESQGQEGLVEVERVIAWGERALGGVYSGNPEDYDEAGDMHPVENTTGESDPTDGVIIDLNDSRRSEDDNRRLISWIEEKLGTPLSEAETIGEFLSLDEETTFKIYKKQFGTPANPWHFSRWQNEGELPSYILWGKGMYDIQLESGFEEI